jgi:3-dehydroquinate synthase
MATAARLAANLGWCEAKTRDEIIALLEKFELPTRIPREFSAEQILSAMGADKKIQNKKLRLILPRTIGRVEIAENISRWEILRALQESIV